VKLSSFTLFKTSSHDEGEEEKQLIWLFLRFYYPLLHYSNTPLFHVGSTNWLLLKASLLQSVVEISRRLLWVEDTENMAR